MVQSRASMVFPTNLPHVQLGPYETNEAYALRNPRASLKAEIKVYEEWCGAPINTERRGKYITSVQSTTLERVETMVLGFLGHVSQHFALAPNSLTLDIYADPTYVAQFIAYLKV
jgi:hypothetical protein